MICYYYSDNTKKIRSCRAFASHIHRHPAEMPVLVRI